MSRPTGMETNTHPDSSGAIGVTVGHTRTETIDTQDSYWFSSNTTAGSPVHSREGSGATVRSAAENGAAYCTACDRMFTNQDALQTHMRASPNHPWYCGQCHVDLLRETDYVVRAER
jgi:Zinc-finger double-stranded RNA-binding